MVSRAIQLTPPKVRTVTANTAGATTIATSKGRIVSLDVVSVGVDATYKLWNSPAANGAVLRNTANVPTDGIPRYTGDGFDALTITLGGTSPAEINITVELD